MHISLQKANISFQVWPFGSFGRFFYEFKVELEYERCPPQATYFR